jgi:molecular chaperone GrpE
MAENVSADSIVDVENTNSSPLSDVVSGNESVLEAPLDGAASEAAPAVGADLATALARVEDALNAVRQELRSADARAVARERVIDRLHEENERLRAGERHLLLRPVQTDLQRLRNDLLREARGLPEPYGRAQAAGLLESYAESVALVLERCGVAVLRPELGAAFDPVRHRATATVAAPTHALDATVAEVVADGYLDMVTDRVVVPASVQVTRWQPPEPTDLT